MYFLKKMLIVERRIEAVWEVVNNVLSIKVTLEQIKLISRYNEQFFI